MKPNASDILQAIDVAYDEILDSHTRWPITPSRFGSCSRELALLLEGFPRLALRPDQRRVFELGHQRGARLAALAADGLRSLDEDIQTHAEMPVWVPMGIHGEDASKVYAKYISHWWDEGREEQPVKVLAGELHVAGSIDLAIWDPLAKWLHVIDFKTAGSYGFGKLDDEGPSQGYVTQLLAYTKAALEDRFEDYDWSATLVYEAKDSDARRGHVGGDLKAIPVGDQGDELAYEQDMARMHHLLLEWAEGRGAFVEPSVPPPGGVTGTAHKLDWRCDYCSVGPSIGNCFGAVEDRSKRPNRKQYYRTELSQRSNT